MTDAELAQLLTDARAARDPQRLADALPYSSFLGLELSLDERGLLGTMRYAEHLIGDASIPALHGGTLAALMESTAIFATLFDEDTVALPRTITLTLDYLRSGRPVDTYCRARFVRRGRRITVVEAAAYQDDPEKPVATAIIHVLLTPPSP